VSAIPAILVRDSSELLHQFIERERTFPEGQLSEKAVGLRWRDLADDGTHGWGIGTMNMGLER
jgi:hypothetical protein